MVNKEEDSDTATQAKSENSLNISTKEHPFHVRVRARSEHLAMMNKDYPSTSASIRRGFFKRGKIRRFTRFLYNKNDRTFCRRTCKSWLAVLTYYFIFVIIVVLICLALLYGCVIFVKRYQHRPWMSKKHLVEDNIPGLSYVPNIDYLSESVIWYKISTDLKERAKKYVMQIEEYYDRLEATCAKNAKYKCNFNRSSLGPCGEENFGYDTDSPCIVVRINKLEDWSPQAYEQNKIPNDVPEDLKKEIENTAETRLWIDCKGLNEYDRDHLKQVDYYPMRGYPEDAFPYTDSNREYYVSPIVALHVNNIDVGRVLCLKCSLYASNYNQEPHYDQLSKTYVYLNK